MISHLARAILAAAGFASVGCVTQSAVQSSERYEPARHQRAQIQRCVDRTGLTLDRDLAAEATRSLEKKVKDSGIFEISADGQLIITCDIEQFVEGSALKRWVLPGSGRTQAQVAVMVLEKPDEKVLITLRSHAEVGSGGLFTIGADKYIMGAAFDDIVQQLKAWVRGAPQGQ
jgi:hypothetical protein